MSREQFETKLEKDRAKETFVEVRLKNLKARAEKFEDDSPKMAAFAKLLEKLSGSSTDEQKINKLEDQFEAIYANTEGYGKTTKKGNVIKGMTGKERVEAQGNTPKKNNKLFLKDGGDVNKFGMLSVKAGVDKNPEPTKADKIVGATQNLLQREVINEI